MAGQARMEELLAKAVTTDGHKERHCRSARRRACGQDRSVENVEGVQRTLCRCCRAHTRELFRTGVVEVGLSRRLQKPLETLIGRYTDKGYLFSGEDNAASRPGSYTVVAREFQDGSGNWYRWFYCENWHGPDNLCCLRFIQRTPTNTYSCCYIEKVSDDPCP